MHKCIFQGRLDFGTQSSFEKALRQFEQRSEVFYKDEVVFRSELVFDESTHSMTIPRTVANITEKFWKNTTELLEYVNDYGLSGQVEAWMVESGKILEYHLFEPKGDKSVITAFKSGRDLLKEEGKEKEALKYLSEAIDKYEKHSQAYERRGYTNLILKRPEDARYDFDKSIRLDSRNAMAYYGRAVLNMNEKKWEPAIDDLTHASKNLLAVQPLFWKVRRLKAESFIHIKDYGNALKELKLMIRRKFPEDDPNYKHIPKVNSMYIRCLMELGEEQEALDYIDESLETMPVQKSTLRRAMLTDRGLVKQRLGEKDFIKDWKEAAELGESRATDLLAEIAN